MSASVQTTISPLACCVPIRRTVPAPPLRGKCTTRIRGRFGSAARSRSSVASVDASSTAISSYGSPLASMARLIRSTSRRTWSCSLKHGSTMDTCGSRPSGGVPRYRGSAWAGGPGWGGGTVPNGDEGYDGSAPNNPGSGGASCAGPVSYEDGAPYAGVASYAGVSYTGGAPYTGGASYDDAGSRGGCR